MSARRALRAGLLLALPTLLPGCFLTIGGSTGIGDNVTIGAARTVELRQPARTAPAPVPAGSESVDAALEEGAAAGLPVVIR